MRHSQRQSQHKLDRLEAAMCTLMEQQNELLCNLQQSNCNQERIDPPGIRSSTPLAPRDQHQALSEAISPAENNAPPSPTGENQQLTLAKVIGQAISEALAPLLAGKNSANLPDKYRGEQDGLVDNWITMMKRYLEKTCAQSSELDRAWTVIEFLEQEARLFVLNKPESERDFGQKVLALLARRFGTGPNRSHIQRQFYARNQEPEEDHMRYLDALEQLRNQAFPSESIETRRLEILQKFIEGARDEKLREYISCQFAQEEQLDNPPTVEALRFSVTQYLHMLRKCDREESITKRDQDTQSPQWPKLASQQLHTAEKPVAMQKQQTFLALQEPQLKQPSAPYAFPNHGNGNHLPPDPAPSHEVPDMVHKINSCGIIGMKDKSETTGRSVPAGVSTSTKSQQTEPLIAPIMCDRATDQIRSPKKQ